MALLVRSAGLAWHRQSLARSGQHTGMTENDVISVKKIGRLWWYMVATLFNSSFTSLTIFGPAFIFFLNDLGLDKARIGVLLALIPFAGVVAPIAVTSVGRFGLRRTFVVFWGLRK